VEVIWLFTANERTGGVAEAVKEAGDAAKSGIRVAMPGIVEAFDTTRQTVSVKLALREKVSQGGTTVDMEIPLLVDVPVVMPRAGGYSLVFAPTKGDECLVVFSDICIDSWWQNGGIQNLAELRRHDFSDGFAILGVWSQARKCAFPSSGVRLQNDAGTAGVSIEGNNVNLFGSVTVNGRSI
jgi:hypothetical protein